MEKSYKFCQSCGMPIKKDENGRVKMGTGRNGDGETRRNKIYLYCVQKLRKS